MNHDKANIFFEVNTSECKAKWSSGQPRIGGKKPEIGPVIEVSSSTTKSPIENLFGLSPKDSPTFDRHVERNKRTGVIAIIWIMTLIVVLYIIGGFNVGSALRR